MELIKYDSDQRQRFPKNLIRLRKERGWTKSKLAQKLGWSYNTITSWERGERMPYQYAIEDICAVFNVTETELLGSPVKLRMFAYYRKGKLTATGTLQEIADQTKQRVDSLWIACGACFPSQRIPSRNGRRISWRSKMKRDIQSSLRRRLRSKRSNVTG